MSDRRVAWVRAQLDATEAAAKAGMDALGDPPCWPDYQTYDSPELGAAESYLAHFSPADMLADVEAKRALLNAHDRPHECISLTGRGEHSVVDGKPWELWEPEHTEDHGPCFVVRQLADGFRHRPGYEEACGE